MTTPWAGMLRLAGAMGVAPEAFWRLSVREWRMLTEWPEAAGPMGRSELDEMARRWPDDSGGGADPSTASRSPSPSLMGRRHDGRA